MSSSIFLVVLISTPYMLALVCMMMLLQTYAFTNFYSHLTIMGLISYWFIFTRWLCNSLTFLYTWTTAYRSLVILNVTYWFLIIWHVATCGGRLSVHLLLGLLHNRVGVADSQSAFTSHSLKNESVCKNSAFI